jgi:acetoin utilization deacetylase AcuC-like enzyme
LYVSIHQSPLFPWTGHPGDVGEGKGTGFTVNLPVPPGSGDPVWVSLVEHVVVPLIYSFEPELVLISAGFDAHRDDPSADCTVTEEGYAAMTRTIARACASLAVPVGGVLEGGYAPDALGRSVAATLEALSTKPASGHIAEPAADLTGIARHARKRVADFWPQLAEP